MGVLLGMILLGVGWHRTFIEMWLRWFPAWHTQNLSLMDRMTLGDSYYTHGPLVPLTSLIIAVFVYKRVGLPIKRSRSAAVVGAIVFLGCLVLHLLSVSPSARVMFVSGYAFIGVVGGILMWWGGWPLARAYWLPVAMLFFMVPMPEVVIVDLNFRLKFLAGRAALWLTNHIFAVPAVMDGSYMYLPPDASGQAKVLVIENVCSGLRSLISLIWFASLFAMVCRVKGLWRLVMLGMAVPVAILSNIIRITSLNLMAHYVSVEVAGPGGWFHDLSGLLVFAMALAILFGLEQLVIVLNRVLKRDWVDIRLLGFLDKLPHVTGTKVGWHAHVTPLSLLALAAVISVYWSASTWAAPVSHLSDNLVPDTLTIGDATFVGEDHELDERSLIILEYPDYLYRVYTDRSSNRQVALLLVFSANNRKGTHPPEVCIEGGGSQIVKKSFQSVSLAGIGGVSFRELLTQRVNQSSYFLYVYKCGDRYTPSFFAQQFWIFVNGLAAKNTAGALIRVNVQVDPKDSESSKQLAIDVAHELLPYIDKGLP